MKKLIIVLAAIAMAVGVQAASMNWSITNGTLTLSDGSSGRASYYTALVFMESDASTVAGYLSSDPIAFDSLSGLAVSTSQAGKAGSFGGRIGGLEGSTASIFAVIFDTAATGDAISTASNYIVSDTITGSTYSGTDSPTTSAFASGNFASSSWASTTVPEPTSGLLALLGVAGLALRRKRA